MPSTATKKDVATALHHTATRLIKAQSGIPEVVGKTHLDLGNRISSARQALQAQAEKIKHDTHDVQRYAIAATLGDALLGFGTSTARMSQAFANNRNIEGGGELLKMVGSLAKLSFLAEKAVRVAIGGAAGAWLGPLGILLGDVLISLGAGLIEGLGPQQKSIAEQLRSELAEFGGRENADRLQGVLDSLQLVQADLQSRNANSLSWDEVNRIGRFTGPDEVIWLGMAENWLRRETKTEVWTTVLEAYSVVSGRYLQNLIIGIAKMKKYEDGKPTENVKQALSVLDEVCKQRGEMLSEVRPKACALATRWFIGGNENLYRVDATGDRRIGSYDTVARSISVTADGERLWHLGSNRAIYTERKGEAQKLSDPCEAFHAVQEPGTGKTQLFMIQNMKLMTRIWDESLEGDLKFDPTQNTIRSLNGVADVNSFIGTPGGVVFLLEGKGRLWIRDDEDNRGLTLPEGTVVAKPSEPSSNSLIGLTADDDVLYVFSAKGIWSRSISKVEDTEAVWTPVPDPKPAALGLGESWRYNDVYAGDDGTLTAIIDDRMYSFLDGTWAPTDGNTAKRVVTYPIRGWAELDGLTRTVEEVKAGVAALRDSSDEGK